MNSCENKEIHLANLCSNHDIILHSICTSTRCQTDQTLTLAKGRPCQTTTSYTHSQQLSLSQFIRIHTQLATARTCAGIQLPIFNAKLTTSVWYLKHWLFDSHLRTHLRMSILPEQTSLTDTFRKTCSYFLFTSRLSLTEQTQLNHTFTLQCVYIKMRGVTHAIIKQAHSRILTGIQDNQLKLIAIRGGFRGVPEVSRNHLGFFPRLLGTPLFSYKVSRGIATQRAEQRWYWLLFRVEAKEIQW